MEGGARSQPLMVELGTKEMEFDDHIKAGVDEGKIIYNKCFKIL